jgi:predicted site-specific integrase-resolvase
MRTYSTKQVAETAAINRVTLQRWLISGKLPEPERLQVGGIDVRVWKDLDLDRVLKYKQAYYRKGRGRKKKAV